MIEAREEQICPRSISSRTKGFLRVLRVFAVKNS
jgi:hypothetical protein